jgi:hypothetical protein
MLDPTDGTERAGQSDHPDLIGIAGEMRAEWRAEQEAAAADAAAQWRYRRGIVDWLIDRMHAGDRIAVAVGGQRFDGLVDEVGEDLVALRCAFGRVEVQVCSGIAISFELVERATKGGTRGAARRRFSDALLARDGQAGVRVGGPQRPDGIDGTLRVGRDYVSVESTSGAETVILLSQIAWVAPAAR